MNESGAQNEIDRLEAEIERLRTMKEDAIEECARLVESIKACTGDYAIERAASLIRALKNKP